MAAGGHGGCRIKPAWSLATVRIFNVRRVVTVRETTKWGRTRRLVVAVGDFHTAVGLSDSLRPTQR